MQWWQRLRYPSVRPWVARMSGKLTQKWQKAQALHQVYWQRHLTAFELQWRKNLRKKRQHFTQHPFVAAAAGVVGPTSRHSPNVPNACHHTNGPSRVLLTYIRPPSQSSRMQRSPHQRPISSFHQKLLHSTRRVLFRWKNVSQSWRNRSFIELGTDFKLGYAFDLQRIWNAKLRYR